MPESVIEMRNRLRAGRPQVARAAAAVSTGAERQAPAPAFALVNPDSNRVVISTPMNEVASLDEAVMQLSGRLVEAEQANRNGAFWKQDDLEFGLPSVAFGPLNWLHEERKIIGALRDPSLVSAEQAAADGDDVGTHIRTDATVWGYVFREEAATIRRYIGEGTAWLSMECIASQIECTGPNGCGALMPYADAATRSGSACQHVKERASHRRFIEPVFRGAAVILPPVQPGWAKADLGAQRTAGAVLEAASLDTRGLDDAAAQQMVAQIIQWSRH